MDPKTVDLEYDGPPENIPSVQREKMCYIYCDVMEDIPYNASSPHTVNAYRSMYTLIRITLEIK